MNMLVTSGKCLVVVDSELKVIHICQELKGKPKKALSFTYLEVDLLIQYLQIAKDEFLNMVKDSE